MFNSKNPGGRRWLVVMLVPLMIFFPLFPALAEGEQMGFTTYYFSDSGGNSVSTTSFNLAKKIFGRTVFLLDLEVDNVHVPAITAVTGATRPKRKSSQPFEKTRGQAIVGLEQGYGDNTALALNLYRSQEVDYTSNSVIGTITREFFQKNTTLSIKGQYIQDEVGKLLDGGGMRKQDKSSLWVVGSFSQILSRTTVLDLSYDALYQEGFLSDPYRQVQVFDQNNAFVKVDEVHPDTRLRQAATAKLSQFLPEIRASISGRYRFYRDDWDVHSHTFEAQLNKYIVNNLIARFNYRYYNQIAAFFYQDRYAGGEYLSSAYRTADYKLQGFNSNNFGFSLTVLFSGIAGNNPDFEFLENSSIEIRYFRYFNTLNFSANIVQMNFNFGM